MAAAFATTGLAFTFLARETHGRPISQDADEASVAGMVAASTKAAAGPTVGKTAALPIHGGRSIFRWEQGQRSAKIGNIDG